MSAALGLSGGGGEGSGDAGKGGAGGDGAAAGGAGSGGTPSASWRDSLPEDIRNEPSLKSFTDIGNLAKSYIHAQTQIGKKGAIVPQWDKASDTEVADFYKAIGVPTADKYEVPLPQGFKGDVSKFKEQAVALGLLPKQAGGLLAWDESRRVEEAKVALAAKQASEKAGLVALKSEWGEAYDKEVNTARFGIKQLFGEEGYAYLDKVGIANDPKFIKAFAKAGKLYGEDKLLGEGIGNESHTMSEIQGQIDDMMAKRKENGLGDKTHPMHQISSDKYAALWKRKTGGK